MRPTLAIAAKDLKQILLDRRSAIFLVLMPVVFTAFLGIAFRWPGHEDPRPEVGVCDLDSTELSGLVTSQLESGGLVQVEELGRAAASKVDDLIRRGRYDLVLVVRAGYAESAAAGPALEAVCDRSEPKAQAALQAVEAVAARLAVSARVGKLVAGQVGAGASAEEMAVRASAGWQEPAFAIRREAFGPAPAKRRAVPRGFAQSSPGTLVQFAIFGMMTASLLLVLERRSRTLGRMLSAPVSRFQVIAGHVLAMFTVTFLQGILLIGLGQFAFKVDYLSAPAGVLVVLAALSLWVASLGLCIGVIARTQEQVSMFSMLAMFLFAAGGGAWFPLEITGRVFSFVGHLLPSAWAMDGFQNVVLRGQGFGSALVPALVITGYAALFFTVAVWRFRAE
ncbi:ABC transporter permease [candidate division WOR-3 bacterium]|uniref:ABC transporter permease n=1 Tax=candidate division WOR-3 bacterium TaxID=2052148 RepID=A0A938BSC2_UNCW3|nr:ABC transporter permease [candidate division WOR-3 bacterium]